MLYNKYMKQKQPDPLCFDCNGTGELNIPAHVEGGVVVDEGIFRCHCTVERSQEDEEYVDE